MKMQIPLLPVLFSCALLSLAQGDETVLPMRPDTTIDAESPLAFVPFQWEELKNPETGRPYAEGELARIMVDGKLFFEGPAADLLAILNETEKYYNSLGHTLRQEGELRIFQILSNAEGALDKALADQLRLRFDILRDRLRPPLTECPELQLADLGVDPRTGEPFVSRARLPLPDGSEMTAEEFAGRVNEMQHLLCALGYSLLDNLDGLGDDAVSELLTRRDRFMNELGISQFNPAFSLQSVQRIKAAAEIAEEVNQAIRNGELPSMETLIRNTNALNAIIPEPLRLPEVPAIPSPVLKPRKDLALKKRKEWPGINYGKRDTFNVYANAWAEVRGSQVEQWVGAEGKAGSYVLGRELNVLYGKAELNAGPAGARGDLECRFLGEVVYSRKLDSMPSHNLSDPKLFSLPVDEAADTTFAIGPVPVTVSVGAKGEVSVGWNVGISATAITASILPRADLTAYGKGAIGRSKILSAGIQADLVLMRESLPVEGHAKLLFDGNGVPFLDLGVNADNHYSFLTGRVAAFAEYPVPAFSVPPWKSKRSTYKIFDWQGTRGINKIMNWSMTLSPFGAQMRGDLVDQTDHDETARLQETVTTDERQFQISKLEAEVPSKESAVFRAIGADLQSDATRAVAQLPVQLQSQAQALDTLLLQYLAEAAGAPE